MTEHVDPADLRTSEKFNETKVEGPSSAAGREAAAPVAKPRRGGLKRLLIGVAAVALLVGAGDFGWRYWTVGRFEQSTDDAYVAADSTIVAPKVSGYLREVLVADNQPVKAGQPLARIDDRDYAVAVKQADANVAAARATVDNIKAGIEQQQAVIAQARSTVTLDQANLVFAQQENDRYATLAKGGAGTVQSAQQAVSRLAIAKATLQRDGAAVTAAEKQIGMLNAQVAKATADLIHTQAVAEQAQLNLSYALITAPVDGVVGNRTLRVGQYVQAGTALMSVVPLSSVYIVANFKETQLAHVRAGQKVTIDIDGFPDSALSGQVDSISPASGQEFALLPPDNATGNFTKIVQRVPVKITFAENTPLAGLMRPGMSVTPTIDTKDSAAP